MIITFTSKSINNESERESRVSGAYTQNIHIRFIFSKLVNRSNRSQLASSKDHNTDLSLSSCLFSQDFATKYNHVVVRQCS